MNNLQILMAERIKKRVEKILTSSDTIDNCVMIISYAYQWVEAADPKYKSDFSSIIFYRNWLFHIQLTEGNIPKKLKEIFRQFSIPESEQNTVDFVAKLLSTKKLRNELKIIFKNIQCDFPILDSLSQWKRFMGYICSELLNKPLEISECRELLINSRSAGDYILPKRLCLVKTEKDSASRDIEFEIQLHKLIVSIGGEIEEKESVVKVRGQLPLDENYNDFLKV